MTSLQKESEWEKEFDDLKKGFLSTVNGEWWASDEDFIKDFISRTIATAVSTREKEIAEEVNKLEKEMPDRIDEEDVPGVTDQVIGHNNAIEKILQLLKH